MTNTEYAEMVDYLSDRFGNAAMDSWTYAAKLYPDFKPLDSECVWNALLGLLDLGGEFPPKAPQVRAAALERMRYLPRPALPATTDTYGWAEYSQRTYGHVKPISEAIREKAVEYWGEEGVVAAEESASFGALVRSTLPSTSVVETDADVNPCEHDEQGKHHFTDSDWGRQCERCGRLSA